MNNLVSRYNSLNEKAKNLNETSSRYEGKLESLNENLKQLGFKNIKEAEEWLEESEKEKADIEFELNNVLDKMDETIDEIERS